MVNYGNICWFEVFRCASMRFEVVRCASRWFEVLRGKKCDPLISDVSDFVISFIVGELRNHFKKIVQLSNEDIDSNDINLLYDLSNGSPGLALQLYSDKFKDLLDTLLLIFKQKGNLSSELINFSEIVGLYSNDQFKLFISILKLILVNILKINLGIDIKQYFFSNLAETIYIASKNVNNNSILKILDYLKFNENDLYILNLDKKIFCINIFNTISK